MDSTIMQLNNFDRSTNKSLTGKGVLAQVRRKHRRIEPLQDETREVKPKSKIDDAFGWIFTFGLYIGLPISSSLYSRRQQRLKRFVMNALLNSWVLANTVFCAFMFVYSFYLFDTNASRFCLFVHCFSSHVLMWVFLFNRRQIKIVVRKLCHLSSSLDFDANGVEIRLKTYMTVAVIHFVANTLIQWLFFFYEAWGSMIIYIRSFTPIAEDSGFYYYYCILVLFSAVYSYNISTLILYFMVFLSSEAYRTSGQLFVLYGTKLLSDINRRSFTATTANLSISEYKAISSCVSNVNSTFGICALVIFLDMSNQFFGAMSLFLAQDMRLQCQLVSVFGALALTMGFVMLCYLIYSGEKVRQGNSILDRQLIVMSDSLMRLSPDTSTLVMFHLLLKDIKTTRSCITVMGLFEVTTKSLLSILSLITTYNATLYQLGANAKS